MNRTWRVGIAGVAAACLATPGFANTGDTSAGLATDVYAEDQETDPDEARRQLLSSLIGDDVWSGRVLWHDLEGKFDSLNTPEKVQEIIDKTAAVGFDTIVLDAGNFSGFVPYDSDIARHVSEAQFYQESGYTAGYDLLAEVLPRAHAAGLEVHVDLNTVSQGVTATQEGPAYDNPEWQSIFYEGKRLAVTENCEHQIFGTNVKRGGDQLILYTPDVHDVSPANEWGVEATVVDGVVDELRDRASDGSPGGPIPEDGVLLSGHGAAADWLLEHATPGSALDYSATDTDLVPAGDYAAEFATFVNPLNQDARDYAQSLLLEVVDKYDVDGVVLDRARYSNQFADFSDLTRAAFEERIGQPVENWPEDIFEITFTESGQDLEPGPLFQDWWEFRASVITGFVAETQDLIYEADPEVAFSIYAGAWYPEYWREGVNWGSPNYQPDYDWTGPNYGSTGYAEYLDFFMAGTYFPEVTIEEAREVGSPEDWYSVEGASQLAMEVTDLSNFLYASLFVLQYEGDEDQFRAAMEMALQETHGVMIFDLVYLELYDWWHVVEEVLGGPDGGTSPHTNPEFMSIVRGDVVDDGDGTPEPEPTESPDPDDEADDDHLSDTGASLTGPAIAVGVLVLLGAAFLILRRRFGEK